MLKSWNSRVIQDVLKCKVGCKLTMTNLDLVTRDSIDRRAAYLQCMDHFRHDTGKGARCINYILSSIFKPTSWFIHIYTTAKQREVIQVTLISLQICHLRRSVASLTIFCYHHIHCSALINLRLINQMPPPRRLPSGPAALHILVLFLFVFLILG